MAKKRWMTSMIEAAKTEKVELPFQRSVRVKTVKKAA